MDRTPKRILLVLFAVVALVLGAGAGVVAQDASPVPAEASPAADSMGMAEPAASPQAAEAPANTTGLSIVASSLAGPRGIAWDGSGAMYVSLSGTGGDAVGVGESMGSNGADNRGGPTASIVKITGGCGLPVVQGLPSSKGFAVRGATGITFLGDSLYFIIASGGAFDANPDWANGIYRVNSDGTTTLVFDLGAWMKENPVAHIPGDFDELGDPFTLETYGGDLLLGEANSGQVLRVTPDGVATRIKDYSENHPVVTAIAQDDAGNLYVGFLTEAPYTTGASRVDKIAPDGTITTVWTGLTSVTGLAFGADGLLYATEMSHEMTPNSGRLVRQTGPDSQEVVVDGLDTPVHLAKGPDDAMYISAPALGSESSGIVIRVDVTGSVPMTWDPSKVVAQACSGAAIPGGGGAAEAPLTQVGIQLVNPRGMAWGVDGTFYVAQAGTGDTTTSVGPAGAVVTIGPSGCGSPLASGLPSSMDPYTDVLGPEDVQVMDGDVYVLQGATGSLKDMDPETPNGIYRVTQDGGLELVVDLTKWLNANPVKNPPGDRNPLGEPYRFLADDGFFWVLDSNTGEVLRVNLDGAIKRVADTSAMHHVATGFALAPGGGVYVGFLTPAPHTDGTAAVIRITADGQMTDVWTGLTTVTAVVVAPDGSLLALEMATGDNEKDGMQPGTGKIVRQTGLASSEDVVTGLDYPIDMEMGPDGALYVAGPAFGAADMDGWIVRVDPSVTGPITAPASVMTGDICIEHPHTGHDDMMGTPTAAETAEPAVEPTAASGGDAAAPVAGTSVEIRNYAFGPAALKVKVGDTVTWTNNDSVPHTVTADDGSFDSGNLAPGDTFTHTFDKAGKVAYHCSYHAGMKAMVVAE